MASYSEGGWLTGALVNTNYHKTVKTLSSGVIKNTVRKKMKTDSRLMFGIITLGITEMAGLCDDYLTHTYLFDGRVLGGSENEAAEKAFQNGYDFLKQSKYDEAQRRLNIAYQTCNKGYYRENLFREERDAAKKKLKEEQRKKVRKEKEKIKQKKRKQQEAEERKRTEQRRLKQQGEEERQKIEKARKEIDEREKETQRKQEEEERQKIEKQQKNQRVSKQRQNLKMVAVCQEDVRKKCKDGVLHRRDKITMCGFAEGYQRIISQIKVENIPDIIQYTEVQENKEDNNYEETPETVIEEKLTWLHQMLKMKNIEYCESDLNKFIKLSDGFDLNFFKTSTQKILRLNNKFDDFLNFFIKIHKCRLTKKLKQDFIQALPDGSSPLHLLAESMLERYLRLKFPNYQSQLRNQLRTYKLHPPFFINLKEVAIESESQQEHVRDLAKIMQKQIIDHWNFSYVDQQLGLIDTAGKIQSMVKILHHVYDFEGTSHLLKINELPDILVNCKEDMWVEQVHELLIQRAFPKIEYSLYDGFKKLDVYAHLKRNSYESFQTFTKSARTTILPNNTLIDKLNQNDIRRWGKIVRSGASNVELYEMIAVVNRAVTLHNGYLPHDVQNMALLLLLDKMESNEGGRLLQVNTGEGKTLIVAMLAVIMTLRGHKVDVITSSPALAEPQCLEMAPFIHDYFDLTASYVTQDCADDIRKEAYKADIVYGAADQFQGDILRDEYSQLGTRSGRKFDVAIVDEVDSMLIDGQNHLVMLSSPVPGMENLESVLATIWNEITLIAKHLIEKNDRVYIIDSCNRINEDGTMKPDEECIDNAIPIEKTKLEFITETTEHFMRLLLRDYDRLDEESKEKCKQYPEMHVPNHLRELELKVQLPKWVKSAIYAKYAYKINQHYIIRNGKIALVDSCNTGIVQENMHLSDGIHQFLQIKHGAKLSPETYTTNYISNVAFFKRYGSRLVGLTGTLGSESAQQLLRKIYNVDTVILPPLTRKQYRQLRPLFSKSEDEWLVIIAQSCIRKLEMGRAVLIIAQFLNQVDKLHDSLVEQGINKNKIFLYKTEKESDVVMKELKSGEIIVATNVAGRGSDISVSKDVEKRGGLHVCLTSLPVNERVEEQNFGRTSRTGNRGTGQFVLLQEFDSTLDELKSDRDKIEKNRLLEGEIKIEKVLMKDRIFAEFCSLLKHVRNRFGTKDRLECENNVRAVEERFGLWLKEHEDELTSYKDFQPFCELIKQELESDTFIKNPYFHVLNGNLEMDRKEFEQAIKKYSRAIELDDRFLSNAYYNRGYCKLVLSSKNSKKELAEEAVEDFRRAKEIIEDRFQKDLLVIQQSAPTSEALSEQVKQMFTLFAMQKTAIECAIGRGKGFVEAEIKRLEKTESKDHAVDLKNYIEELRTNKFRIEEGIIGEALQKYDSSFNVILNSIESSLPEEENLSLFECEIDTFKNNGNLGCFNVHYVKPIEWGSVISLALIGILQIVSGAAIGIFTGGAGATFCFGMLTEGIADLITCIVNGIINRDFSWAAWGVQKLVSYSVSIACAGILDLKEVVNVAYHGIKGVVAEGITTAGWQLAAKKIGLELGKGVANKLIVKVANYSLNYILMLLVENLIHYIIRNPIKTMVNNNKDVDVLLEVDSKRGNAYYQQQIIQKAMEIFKPNSQNIAGKSAQELLHGLQNIAEKVASITGKKLKAILDTISQSKITEGSIQASVQIAEGVASNKKKGLLEVIMLANIVKILSDLNRYFDEFIKKMMIEITSIADKYQKIENEQQKSKCQNTIASEEQVKLEAVEPAYDQLSEKLVQAVTSKILNIINSEVISPLMVYAADKGVNRLTSKVHKNLNDQIEKLEKSQRRIVKFQDGKNDKNHKQGIRNPEAFAKAKQIIDDVENGGKAGLPMLGATSDTINKPVTVLDEIENVKFHIGENKPGEPVYIQNHETTENRSGHWTGPNNNEPNIEQEQLFLEKSTIE